MLTVTVDTLEGVKVKEYKGIVKGLTVRSPTLGQSVMGDLKKLIGGKIGAYAKMCEQARQHAYDLMVEHAKEMGANAVLGVRYDASEVGTDISSSEILCYGTAVIIEDAS